VWLSVWFVSKKFGRNIEIDAIGDFIDMKESRLFILYFANVMRAVLTAAVILAQPAMAEESSATLRLSSGNLPPVHTPTQDGYMDLLLVELFRRAGFTIQFIDLPPRRALQSANSGLHDGDAARRRSVGASFPNLRMLEPAIVEVEFVGLYLDPAINVVRSEDFHRYAIGYIHGWDVSEELFKNHPNATAVSDPVNLLKMLEEKRIDVAFLTRAPGQYFAENHNLKGVRFTEFRLKQGLHLNLHKKYKNLLPRLETLLAEMRADGTYANLTAGYASQ